MVAKTKNRKMALATALPTNNVDLRKLATAGVEFSETALIVRRDLTRDEWKSLGKKLVTANKASNWWLGDWIISGPNMSKFRKSVHQTAKDRKSHRRITRGFCQEIADLLGVSPGHVSNMASVCNRVPPEFRRGITTGHAIEILRHGVPDTDFPKWADRVIKERLSCRQLRVLLRQSHRTEKASPATTRPVMFGMKHLDFVRDWARESETWTEAQWQGYAAWHKPVIESLKSRGLL